jgi:eukaryotic-like serine/threonine-protein kinase
LRTGPCGAGRAVFAAFEFDLATHELRKGGVRRRLEDKPARALAFLIENRAAVVERQDLIILLWPGESHGDFDHRLNKVINKVRLALGDDSSEPRFIQTLNRWGYRFIAEVSIVGQASDGLAPTVPPERSGANTFRANPPIFLAGAGIQLTEGSNSESMFELPDTNPVEIADAAETDEHTSQETLAAPNVFSSFQTRRQAVLSAVAIFLVGISVLFAKLSHTQSSSPEARKSIAVVGFANLTGNPDNDWLSPALAGWITSDLANGSQLRVISMNSIEGMRTDTEGMSNLSPDALVKLRKNLGADFVMSGSYARISTGDAASLQLDLEIQDASGSAIPHTIRVAGQNTETFALASAAAAQLREWLRLAPLAQQGLETVREMLPRSPQAARFYTEGVARLERSNAVDARALLLQAIAIEPQHALSHSALSTAYSELGYSEKAREEAKTAFSFSRGLPLAEKLLVEGQFRETSFDWEKASDVYRSLTILFPENLEYGLRLAHSETSAGKAAMAFETLRHFRQLKLSAVAEAEVDIAEAEAAASISDFHRQQETAARAAAEARESEDSLLAARAETIEGEGQRAVGNFPQAVQLWADASERFAAFGDRRAIARVLVDQGALRWQQGDLLRSEQSYDQAIATSREIGDEAELGRALAGLGQIKMYRVSSKEGKKLCDDALAIFRRIGNQPEEAYVLSLIADTMAWRHADAKPLYEQSLEISRKVNDRSRTAGRLMDLGIIATVQGDLAMAEQDLQESLGIYHEIGERNREALLMSRLAIVFKWQGRLDDAEQLSRQAVDILNSIGETSVRGQVRQNLALIQLEAGKLTEAHESMRLAMDEHRQAGDLGGLDLANINMAEILAAEGKSGESRAALEEVGKLAHWNLMPGEHVATAILTRARLYSSEREFSTALREAQRACDEALRMDQGSLYLKAQLVLDEIELQSGNQKEARRHLEDLARDAETKGFGLINNQARKALEIQRPSLTAVNSPVR